MLFKKKDMVLGKRAWQQKKRAWRCAVLKQAGGNTIHVHQKMSPFLADLRRAVVSQWRKNVH